MKKIMSTLGLLSLAGILFAGTLIDVPAKVKNAFLKKFPKAEEVEWASENGNYTASCYNDGYFNEIVFGMDGTWLKSVTYLDEMDLPEATMIYVESNYTEHYISEARLEENKEGKQYHVNLMDETEEIVKLIFDESGKLK